MNNTKEEYRKKIRNCEQNFKEKLFLASFDLMSLNISARLVFRIYLFFDFLFIAYYPLDHLYNKSKSSHDNHSNNFNKVLATTFSYLNPSD